MQHLCGPHILEAVDGAGCGQNPSCQRKAGNTYSLCQELPRILGLVKVKLYKL
jgi:hypothetical protein